MRKPQINHRRDCTHAQTPQARKACRNASRTVDTPTYDAMKLGRGHAVHLAARYDDGDLLGAKCGSGIYRGVRRQPTMLALGQVASEGITCTKCAKLV